MQPRLMLVSYLKAAKGNKDTHPITCFFTKNPSISLPKNTTLLPSKSRLIFIRTEKGGIRTEIWGACTVSEKLLGNIKSCLEIAKMNSMITLR